MADQSPPDPERVVAFGPFRLLPGRQQLLEGDKPVRLGSRALAILSALAERTGEVVSKDELVAQVWPGTFVDEANLRVHVAALRKALGDGRSGNRYLTTIPGRGYCFVAPVSLSRATAPAPSNGGQPRHDLPAPLTPIVGRSEIVRDLAVSLPEKRFITIVGPGGIGKTTVALAVADALSREYEDGIRFVDLSTVSDPPLVLSALATALGVAPRSDDPLAGLTDHLKDKHMMLVLDCCEHVIDVAALLAEMVFNGAPDLNLLATSREPLRAGGEHVVRLGPLGLPPSSVGLSAAAALKFPAIQLFVERATASLNTFELTDANAPIASDICMRLDGIALAIELAAGQVDVFGLQGLAEQLGNRFRILGRGRRTVLPRHRTLAATLDWSYELLPEPERIILRRLAVFSGGTTLDGAIAVAADADMPSAVVVDGVVNLAAKSLISADVGGEPVLYRLLDTTRAYSVVKLSGSGELDRIARRHAEYIKGLFEKAEAEWQLVPADAWLATYSPQIGNLRAALDWALSSDGDPALAVALTVAAIPLWFQLSLIDECRARVERALTLPAAASSRSKRQEMQLYAALGWSLFLERERASTAWATALDLAKDLRDADYQLRALWGLWTVSMHNSEFGHAHRLATEFHRLAVTTPNPTDRLIGNRIIGFSLHFLGDQAGARQQIEHMLARYVAPEHGADIVRFQFDQRVTASIALARILWLQGFVDQSISTVESNVARALSDGHRLSLCNVLAQAACPIALLIGDLAMAERYIALLVENTASHGVHMWRVYCDAFKGQVLISRGDFDNGLPVLRTAINELRKAKFVQYETAFLAALAEGLIASGQVSEALVVVDEALTRSERNEERWCLPEFLRLKGEAVLLENAPDAAAGAEEHFLRSLDRAGDQGALSWELRTTISLAQLLRKLARRREARGRLAAVYGRFSEGFGTAALNSAKALIEELS